MENALFVRETTAIRMAEAIENIRTEIAHTSVHPVNRRGEMKGYEVKIKWTDGAYTTMTEDQVVGLEGV